MSTLVTTTRRVAIKLDATAPGEGAAVSPARSGWRLHGSSLEFHQPIDGGTTMPSVTINDIDDELEARLRTRASRRGRSIEDEVRDILSAALSEDETPHDPRNLLDVIRSRVEPLGGIELNLPERRKINGRVDFDE
ncbi:hypothetical protein ACFQVB_23365 [Paraburkholderia humisilvae]